MNIKPTPVLRIVENCAVKSPVSSTGYGILPYLYVSIPHPTDRSYSKVHPVWMEPIESGLRGFEEFILTRFVHAGAKKAQQIETYTDLENKVHGDFLYYRANCVGLIHLLDEGVLPENHWGPEDKAVLFIQELDGLTLFGAWADSRGAAERYIKSL